MPQNFTDAVSNVLQEAFQDATERHNTEVTENHLLAAFLKDRADYFSSILSNLKLPLEALEKEVEGNLKNLATYSGSPQVPIAARCGSSFEGMRTRVL